MKPNDIRAEIMRKGTTAAAIAREAGVSDTTVRQVIKGAMRSARVEAVISGLLGCNAFPKPRAVVRRQKTTFPSALQAAA